MRGLLGTIGVTIDGWAGWWLGARVGLITAVLVSAVGMGVGLYPAQRLVREYLE